MDKALLEKYARLVIGVGVNLQDDQLLVINSPLECREFALELSKAGWEAGAHDVIISWSDEEFAHLRFAKGRKSLFTEFPEWRVRFYQDYAEQGAAFVSVAARNPEIFKDIEPERLTLAARASGAALLEYRARLMNNQNTWCVVSVPTAGWAEKVFPGVQDAEEKLWQEIFRAVRIDDQTDPVKAWQEHVIFLKKASDFMNGHRFKRLRYRNGLGTDLVIELPDGHIWAGGAEKSATGVTFVANMPTEEIYTLPAREGVNGVVYAAKPLIYNGNRIENFWLRFEKGRVAEYHAATGQDTLKELLATDEGARYLGEVALVPYDSPISRSGILFYNTLFDENAACHLALGKAYPTCIDGGEEMDSVTLLQRGVNDSLVHEDFMIGTRDLDIVGIKADGIEVQVFKEGNFAF